MIVTSRWIRCLMAVGDGGDDVLGTKGRIATKKDLGQGGLVGGFVELGQAPLVELDAQVLFNPRECVFLTHGQ